MLFKCYELQKEPGYYSDADRALSVYTNSGHRPFFLNKSLQIALEEDFTKNYSHRQSLRFHHAKWIKPVLRVCIHIEHRAQEPAYY